MQILIEAAAPRHQSRRVGLKQLDDGIGYIFVRAVVEKPCKKNGSNTVLGRRKP
jgi:hypothetical protein